MDLGVQASPLEADWAYCDLGCAGVEPQILYNKELVVTAVMLLSVVEPVEPVDPVDPVEPGLVDQIHRVFVTV